jgi:ribosomal protein S17E
MNEQEYQLALIEAKQEALNWQEKYMAQRDGNSKQSEKIIRQATRIAELEELYKGAQSKENERRVENLANGLSKMLENQLAYFTRIKESADSLIEQFKKG